MGSTDSANSHNKADIVAGATHAHRVQLERGTPVARMISVAADLRR